MTFHWREAVVTVGVITLAIGWIIFTVFLAAYAESIFGPLGVIGAVYLMVAGIMGGLAGLGAFTK